MEDEASYEVLTGFSRPGYGPGSRDSVDKIARLR
jgi:hypothetical protein